MIEDGIDIPEDFLEKLLASQSDEMSSKPIRQIEQIENDLVKVYVNTLHYVSEVDDSLARGAEFLLAKQTYHAEEILRKKTLKSYIRARMREIKFSEKKGDGQTDIHDDEDGYDDIDMTKLNAKDDVFNDVFEVKPDEKVLDILKQVIQFIVLKPKSR